MFVPGTAVPMLEVMDEPPLLSTLVTLTSYCGVRLSLSTAVLLAWSVSLAAEAFTVLTSCAVADGSTAAVTVYTTLAPGAREAMLSLMTPATLLWPLPLQEKLLMPVG